MNHVLGSEAQSRLHSKLNLNWKQCLQRVFQLVTTTKMHVQFDLDSVVIAAVAAVVVARPDAVVVHFAVAQTRCPSAMAEGVDLTYWRLRRLRMQHDRWRQRRSCSR